MFSKITKEEIALTVIKILFPSFSYFPENKEESKNSPFHESFLNATEQYLRQKQ